MIFFEGMLCGVVLIRIEVVRIGLRGDSGMHLAAMCMSLQFGEAKLLVCGWLSVHSFFVAFTSWKPNIRFEFG